ncbi:hypothetical protein [Brevundimonas sp.]|uniref:hypothetical protein n=1 Tax=Brevundimonas sp. TaxID=1871086 RepID=UPI0025FA46E9|nr:hypothetical protein [Brevundimonas sp.]
MRVLGWKLDRRERDALLALIPPAYDRVVADHVTLRAGAGPDEALPRAVNAEIVGATDDHGGVQALVVAIDGETDRPDGSTYHITWSLGSGRSARESNDVLRERGWRELDPMPVTLVPAAF